MANGWTATFRRTSLILALLASKQDHDVPRRESVATQKNHLFRGGAVRKERHPCKHVGSGFSTSRVTSSLGSTALAKTMLLGGTLTISPQRVETLTSCFGTTISKCSPSIPTCPRLRRRACTT